MQLTDEQKTKVQQWITEGQRLSEIQDRLSKEFDLHLTYMDARLLVDDLKLTPQDPVVAEPVKTLAAEGAGTGEPALPDEALAEPSALAGDAVAGTGKVAVTVDTIMRAGAMVSGKVTFSDGKGAEWYVDQYGRFGLVPPEPGYRPSQTDLAEFQAVLDRELAKLGM